MAIYHLSIKPVQRSQGKSATAAAAYRSGARIEDARTGERHDYRKRHGVEASQIITPDGSEPDRATLWNMAEEAEKRKDGTPAREYEIALPSELDPVQRKELALEFGKLIVERHGVAVDIAIHSPTEKGDQRNDHAHILATTRKLENGKLTSKSDFDLSDRDRKKKGLPGRKQELLLLREEWERLVNEALARAGKKEKISNKTLEAQGIKRPPTVHLGPAAMAMERRGIRTERGNLNREALNAPARKISGELEQLREQEAGISEARVRYAEEKVRRIAEEEERIKKYELEILGERGTAARGEERARAGVQEDHRAAIDSRTDERFSEEESARDQGQSRTNRLAAGSDRAARGSGKIAESAKLDKGNRTETRAGNQPDQAGYESVKPASGAAGGRPEKHGTDAGEFGGRAGLAFEPGEAGSLQSSRGHHRPVQQVMGSDQGAGGESRFTLKIRELEERILWLAQEYRNIVDLLAIGRKGGKQRQLESMAEEEQPAPRRPRM